MSDCPKFDEWWAEKTAGIDVEPRFRTAKTAHDAFKAGSDARKSEMAKPQGPETCKANPQHPLWALGSDGCYICAEIAKARDAFLIDENVRYPIVKEITKQLSIENIKYYVDHPGDPWPWSTTQLMALCEVWKIGFEQAHTLHDCGHSLGDYRAPNYPHDEENYSCVGCDSVATARDAALVEAAKAMCIFCGGDPEDSGYDIEVLPEILNEFPVRNFVHRPRRAGLSYVRCQCEGIQRLRAKGKP